MTELIRRMRLPLQVAAYMLSALRAVAQCHAVGYLHRDVKAGKGHASAK